MNDVLSCRSITDDTQAPMCVCVCVCMHRSGALNVGVRELLAHYMALEEMYMYETATMAIRIDEVCVCVCVCNVHIPKDTLHV